MLRRRKNGVYVNCLAFSKEFFLSQKTMVKEHEAVNGCDLLVLICVGGDVTHDSLHQAII